TPPRGAAIHAALREDGSLQPADPAPSAPRQHDRGLRRRADLEVSRLHELRLAVRNLSRDGAAGVRRAARTVPDAEDRDAPRRRDDSLLPQARAAVLGLQRKADGLPARRADADPVAGRLLPDVLLRNGSSG